MRRGAYAAVSSALVLAMIGALAWAVGEPWLFPSLGPTVFLQTVTPHAPSAKAFNTLAGHAIGLAAGIAAVLLCGAAQDPSAMASGSPTLAQVGATALAIGLSIIAQSAIGAEHPPAAATTMLLTLGGFQLSLPAIGAVALGVILVTGLGEAARYLHLRIDSTGS